MKAIVYREYGSPDVLELEEIDKPVPEADEVLVRVHAASANPHDWHFMRGEPYMVRMISGLLKPRTATVLGGDMAGQVEVVGNNVTRFRPGDDVFADVEFGGCAEYVCVPDDLLEVKPANLTFEQAAAVPMAALTALQGLRDKGRIHAGQKVLVNGASGGVGTFAVQLAKSYGTEVTGVCSTRNVALVRTIGADQVIDYTREDFTHSGQRYDVMLDLVGNHSPAQCRRVLNPRGVYIASFGRPDHRWIGPMARMFGMIMLSPFVSQKMVAFVQKPSQDDLGFLKELIEAGKVTPVIDRTYPLTDVPEAIRYLEEGHARGKVVIAI